MMTKQVKKVFTHSDVCRTKKIILLILFFLTRIYLIRIFLVYFWLDFVYERIRFEHSEKNWMKKKYVITQTHTALRLLLPSPGFIFPSHFYGRYKKNCFWYVYFCVDVFDTYFSNQWLSNIFPTLYSYWVISLWPGSLSPSYFHRCVCLVEKRKKNSKHSQC